MGLTTRSSLVLGLCGAPDVPQGTWTPLFKPQEVEDEEAYGGGSKRITFELHLTSKTEAIWETVLIGTKLYIQVPSTLLPDGSREAFITLLEYAEEVLHCTDIVVCLKKDRPDRPQLVRTFMYLGFSVLPPGHSLIPHSTDSINLYMRYSVE